MPEGVKLYIEEELGPYKYKLSAYKNNMLVGLFTGYRNLKDRSVRSLCAESLNCEVALTVVACFVKNPLSACLAVDSNGEDAGLFKVNLVLVFLALIEFFNFCGSVVVSGHHIIDIYARSNLLVA